MTKSRKQLILSITFLLSSFALWNLTSGFFTPQVATTQVTCETVQVRERPQCQQANVAPCAFSVEGVWEQYSIHDGERTFMARLDIRQAGADFQASPLELSADTFPKHAYRSYDHQFSDGIWTFREDWDNGEVGEFALQPQADGSYVGYAHSAGCSGGFQTVFVRVAE